MGVVAAYQSMTVSVEQEQEDISPKKGLKATLIIIILIAIASGMLNSAIDGYSMMNTFVMPGILFICCIIPAYYVFRLRKKEMTNWMMIKRHVNIKVAFFLVY
ncbi:hypothetical protein [Marinilactibacillus piezotolerans]|uniref:hypothetical protein n=1 Tax=Marinilactibacillus piezotolerans TaxID=258723 RepID=UPI00117D9F50|nr:hypothetical protein [Marinilactibacillus piezotolerans]